MAGDLEASPLVDLYEPFPGHKGKLLLPHAEGFKDTVLNDVVHLIVRDR